MYKILLVVFVVFSFSCKNRREINVIGEDSSTLTAINDVKAKFEQENDIKVNLFPMPYDEALEKSNFDLANGTGKYDLLLQYNFALSSYVNNDYILKANSIPLSINTADIFEGTWKEVGYYYADTKNKTGEQIVGFPFAANTMVLVYNKELFNSKANQSLFFKQFSDSLKVPSSWEEFFKVSKFFSRDVKGTKGICLEGADGGWLYYEVVQFLFGMGKGVMQKQYGWQSDGNTPLVLNSPENVTALNKYLSLKDENYGSFYDVDMGLQLKLMQEGKAAMAFMWSDIIPQLSNDARFGYALIPGGKSFLAGGAYFINKKTKVTKEVLKFIEYLYSYDVQKSMVKKGLSSPLKSIYSDSSLQNIPYLSALQQSLERGEYMLEASEEAEIVNQAITNQVKKAWKGEIDAKTALDLAHQEILLGQQKIKKSNK